MYKYILVIILIVSCGSDPEETPRSCSLNETSLRTTWTSIDTGIIYDITTCDPDTSCELTSDGGCGNNAGDIKFIYNNAGGISVEDCQTNETFTGQWQICDGRLELYNLSNGNSTQVFR